MTLRTAATRKRRYTAYLVSGTAAWLAARLAWVLVVLGGYGLARLPEFASYC